MDGNWGFVAAGYAVTVGTLAVYGAWMWQRLRRARRDGELDA